MAWAIYHSFDKRRDIRQLHLQEWNLINYEVVIVVSERVVFSSDAACTYGASRGMRFSDCRGCNEA